MSILKADLLVLGAQQVENTLVWEAPTRRRKPLEYNVVTRVWRLPSGRTVPHELAPRNVEEAVELMRRCKAVFTTKGTAECPKCP